MDVLVLPHDVLTDVLRDWLTPLDWWCCGGASRGFRAAALEATELVLSPLHRIPRREAWGWLAWHTAGIVGAVVDAAACPHTPLVCCGSSEGVPPPSPGGAAATYGAAVAYTTDDHRNVVVVHPNRSPCFFALGFGERARHVSLQRHAAALAGTATVRVVPLAADGEDAVFQTDGAFPGAWVVAVFLHPRGGGGGHTLAGDDTDADAATRCAVVLSSGVYAEYAVGSSSSRPHTTRDFIAHDVPAGAEVAAAAVTTGRVGAVVDGVWALRVWDLATEAVLFEAAIPGAAGMGVGLALAGPLAALRTTAEAGRGAANDTVLRVWAVGGGFSMTMHLPPACAAAPTAAPCLDVAAVVRGGHLRVFAPARSPCGGHTAGFFDVSPVVARAGLADDGA